MKVLQKYPSFSYKRSVITDGRIIILDEPLSQEARRKLEELETLDGQKTLFLDDVELAEDLEEVLNFILAKKQDILFVFPGNGANYPRVLSRVCQKFYGTSVFAKRFWQPGQDPIVMAGMILPDIFLITKVKSVLVVDDVISSGLTMKKLYQNNAWRFTQAKWIGASWVSQIPQMKSKSGINGYDYVATACLVGRTDGSRVPINSISTLRREGDIAQSYAYRHFEDPKGFLHLIKQATKS